MRSARPTPASPAIPQPRMPVAKPLGSSPPVSPTPHRYDPGFVEPPGAVYTGQTAAAAAKPLTREELIQRYLSSQPGKGRDTIAEQLRSHGVVEDHLGAGRVASEFGHQPHWIQGADGKGFHGRIGAVERPLLLDREGRLVHPAAVSPAGASPPSVAPPTAVTPPTSTPPPTATPQWHAPTRAETNGFVDLP